MIRKYNRELDKGTENIRVDEITALLVEVVKNAFCGLLITFSHKTLPSITKIHATQA